MYCVHCHSLLPLIRLALLLALLPLPVAAVTAAAVAAVDLPGCTGHCKSVGFYQGMAFPPPPFLSRKPFCAAATARVAVPLARMWPRSHFFWTWVFALRYNDFLGSAAAQAGGLATSVLINLSIITASARPPLHRITYLNQGTHARRVLPSLRKGLFRAAHPGIFARETPARSWSRGARYSTRIEGHPRRQHLHPSPPFSPPTHHNTAREPAPFFPSSARPTGD